MLSYNTKSTDDPKMMKSDNYSTKDKENKLWDNMCEENGFKVLGAMGEGTFGTVMKVQCLNTKNEYAVKLINRAF